VTLAERCRIHADKMKGEGWYVTANVLAAASDELECISLAPDKAMERARAIYSSWVERGQGFPGGLHPETIIRELAQLITARAE
jgi:hypothetical protein